MNFSLITHFHKNSNLLCCYLSNNYIKEISTQCVPGNAVTKNQAIDYNHFTNAITKRRRPAMLREMTHKLSLMPTDTISLAVGVPNVETFPFEQMNINLKSGKSLKIEGKDLGTALQYLPSRGYGKLINWLMKLQDTVHEMKDGMTRDWGNKTSILVSAGGQEALCNTIEMCIQEGDSMLVQDPVYPAVIDIIRPYRLKHLALPQDKDGIQPNIIQQHLDHCLERGFPLPKLLYVNPIGSNPSGVCLSNERKKIIYDLACKYNFLILEDDPYYFINFVEEKPISFLSLDKEGRVIRYDSFSKIISSGLRLGFVTGPSAMIRNIELNLHVSTLHASGLSQMIMCKMFELYGVDGLLENFKKVKEFYEIKKCEMEKAVENHLQGLAEWNHPTGGMFLWIKLKGIKNVYNLVMNRCVDKKLLVMPGHAFLNMDYDNDCSYVRLTYSLATKQQMDEGCARLAEIIRAERCSLNV